MDFDCISFVLHSVNMFSREARKKKIKSKIWLEECFIKIPKTGLNDLREKAKDLCVFIFSLRTLKASEARDPNIPTNLPVSHLREM